MKKILSILCLVMFSVTLALAKDVKTAKFITTPQWQSQTSEASIKKGLRKEKGIKSVETCATKQAVIVKYDADKTNVDNILQVLDKIGYKAVPIKDCCKQGKKDCCKQDRKDCCKQGRKDCKRNKSCQKPYQKQCKEGKACNKPCQKQCKEGKACNKPCQKQCKEEKACGKPCQKQCKERKACDKPCQKQCKERKACDKPCQERVEEGK